MATNVEQPAAILLFGQDHALVQTRQWILQKDNLRVHPVMSLLELDRIAAQETITLFVLCDSLHQSERDCALALIHSSWPGTKRLVLAPPSITDGFASNEEVFPAMEGPRNLVITIRTLIVNKPLTAA